MRQHGTSHIPKIGFCAVLLTLGACPTKRTAGARLFGLDPGKLAKPSHQTVLERILGIRNQSFPVL
jgi:hypothetical protein